MHLRKFLYTFMSLIQWLKKCVIYLPVVFWNKISDTPLRKCLIMMHWRLLVISQLVLAIQMNLLFFSLTRTRIINGFGLSKIIGWPAWVSDKLKSVASLNITWKLWLSWGLLHVTFMMGFLIPECITLAVSLIFRST